jgi:hypothetical protein
MDTPVPDSDPGVAPELAKRPWTTPRLVVHGQIPALTFAAPSTVTKTPP